MALIFDKFVSLTKAESFAAYVRKKYNRKASVWKTQQESDGPNPFKPSPDGEVRDVYPFLLTPPIVMVERTDGYAQEDRITQDVEKFEGVFAGT